MKSIVRRETGEDWNQYVRRLMVEAGEAESPEDPTDEEVRRFDRKRSKKNGGPGRTTSNAQWVNPNDTDARITKMKDGRTHLAYKAENVIDLESEVILAAEICEGTETGIASDAATLVPSVTVAVENIERSGGTECITEVVADKGYHAVTTLADFWEAEVRTYIPERKPGTKDGRRKWKDKSWEEWTAYRNNHERLKRPKNKQLQRLRSERVERSFAHVCESGGARRSWLRGVEKVQKRYQMVAAARNLGLVMRWLFGSGTPRGMAERLAAALAADFSAWLVLLLNLFHERSSRPIQTAAA